VTDIVDRLRRSRQLDNEEAVEEFERALTELPDSLDPQTLDDLHLVLYDDAVVPEVMYDLVHRLERTPMDDLEASLLRVLPRLSETAPWWAKTLVMRVLNNEEARGALLRLVQAAPDDQGVALRAVLRQISEEPYPVARTAGSMIDELEARSGGSA
jgi:hypothetical protein